MYSVIVVVVHHRQPGSPVVYEITGFTNSSNAETTATALHKAWANSASMTLTATVAYKG